MQKSMLELKGYIHPPEILSDVIVATLLVLGEPENDLRVRYASANTGCTSYVGYFYNGLSTICNIL